MKRKYEYHHTIMNKETFNTRYGQITVTVVCDKTVTVVHNQLEFQIPNTMSTYHLLEWKQRNAKSLEQLRKDEKIN